MDKFAEVITNIKDVYVNDVKKKIVEGEGEITGQRYLFNMDVLNEQIKEKGYKKVMIMFVTDGTTVFVLDTRNNVLAYTNVLLGREGNNEVRR